jgi:hypothetical protein
VSRSLAAQVEAGRRANLEARSLAENSAHPHEAPKPLRVADAKAPVPDLYVGMNKTERRRAEELQAMKLRGEIVAWWFGAVTFKLADDTRYTPDFLVQECDGSLRCEEIKGFWRDDAKVKTKVFARCFPFPLVVLKKAAKGHGWAITEIKR